MDRPKPEKDRAGVSAEIGATLRIDSTYCAAPLSHAKPLLVDHAELACSGLRTSPQTLGSGGITGKPALIGVRTEQGSSLCRHTNNKESGMTECCPATPEILGTLTWISCLPGHL